MKVLFINSRLNSQQVPGGDTVQIEKTRSALQGLGVTIYTREPNERDDWPAGCDLVHLFNIQEPESAWNVFRVAQSRGIPVVLSPIYWDMYAYWFEMAVSGGGRWSWLANQLGKARICKAYVRWQGLKAPTRTEWQLQRRLLIQAKRILPNSPSEAMLLKETFLLRREFLERVDVVPNAIDASCYVRMPVPSQQFFRGDGAEKCVLQVGTIYPVKNQLGLIEALYDLPVKLVFVGQVMEAFSEYAGACKARAVERGNVCFINRVPHVELPGVYASAAVHVLPSWRETPGLVSLEAAAAGCRIVTTSIGSARDYFGDQAWYCYPNDLESIRQVVVAALESPPSGTLRQQVLEKYTWQRAAEATVAAYQRSLS